MSDFAYDSALTVSLADLDGTDAVVVLVGAGYVPDTAHATVADLSDELDRATVAMSVTVTPGALTLELDTDPELDPDGATTVTGWVLATDGATDADRVLLRFGQDPGGTPPDPYVVSCPTGALRSATG